jgi:wyosine [tRNA(Phe)-imidazoG37] synthetase (radical SAM superfamily)
MEEAGSTETTVKFYQTIWDLTTSSHLQMSNKAHMCVRVCVWCQNLNFMYISSFVEALPFSEEYYIF